MAVATSGKSAGTAFSGDESEATEAGTTEASDLRSAAAAEALLLDVVHRHADELLRVARAHSLCADDAHDAYQRSLEHFLRNGRRLRRETADRWLFTVVKREAGAVRRARSTLVASEDVDFDRLEARWDASPEDRALAADAVSRSAEALRSLKPQEVRALWLRADRLWPTLWPGFISPVIVGVFGCCPESRSGCGPVSGSRFRRAATRETGPQSKRPCSGASFLTQGFSESRAPLSRGVSGADLRSCYEHSTAATEARGPEARRAVL